MIFAQALVCRHLGRGESLRVGTFSGGRGHRRALRGFGVFFVTTEKFPSIKESGSDDARKRLCFRSRL